jgi:hypothetical protein
MKHTDGHELPTRYLFVVEIYTLFRTHPKSYRSEDSISASDEELLEGIYRRRIFNVLKIMVDFRSFVWCVRYSRRRTTHVG